MPEPTPSDAAARIAVLPFESLTDDPERIYFARGFLEDLIVELARFPQIEILHRDASLGAPDAPADLLAYGVTHVLRGTVRGHGGARVNAQLVEAGSGRQLWAERFDAPDGDVLALQDRIVERVASTLAIEIDSERLKRARRKPLGSLEVYDCWLRGVDALRRGTVEGDQEARAFFGRALELDDTCARAHAGLSLSHFNEWSCQTWERWDETERLAFEYATRAAELDDGDAQVQMVLARIRLYRREFEEAARLAARALELGPSDADVLAQAAICGAYLGDGAGAVERGQKAMRLHPRHPAWYVPCLAVPLFVAGRLREAMETALEAPRAFVDLPAYVAASAALCGEGDLARVHLRNFLDDFRERILFGREPEPGEPMRWIEHVNPFRRPQDLETFARGLALAGLTPDPDAGARRVAGGAPKGPPRGTFRADGDGWLFAFHGEVVRLHEVKGFHDLAALLARPGQPLHCLELAGRAGEPTGADPALDERARRELRGRLRDLEAEIEEADREGDPSRAERARTELDGLVTTLVGALGLGGRPRRVGSPVERARSAVTWRIRSAVRKIGAAHPALGRHLENAVRTGTTCVYLPETPVAWAL